MKEEKRIPDGKLGAIVILASAILVVAAYFFLKKEAEPRIAAREPLTSGSITDLFSDARWIDGELSSLVQNIGTDAIFFPPRFTWEKAKGISWEKGEEEKMSGFKIEGRDVSEFFDVGLMRGGFQPYMIEGEGGWYVWSKDERKPVLVKVYKNEKGGIAGAFDFSEMLFGEDVSGIEVKKGERENELLVLVKRDPDPSSVFIFQDRGFLKDGVRRVVSKNMNSFPAEVRRIKIAEVKMTEGEGEASRFFVSADGKNWKDAAIGEEVAFTEGNGIFWKAEVNPNADTRASWALQSIRLEYSLFFPEGFEGYKKRMENGI